MGTLATTSFQCGWIPEGPVAYQLYSGSSQIKFDQNSKPSVQTVSVTAYRLNGTGRTQISVNGDRDEFAVVLRRWLADGTEMSPAQVTAQGASAFRNCVKGRFDLVPSGAIEYEDGIDPVYDEKEILVSHEVGIVRDGQDGNGSYTWMVFMRCPVTPTRPTGGTYDNPTPGSVFTYNGKNYRWTDSPTSGSDSLWVSTARFESTHTGTASPTWSDPVPAADSSDLELIWSAKASPAKPVSHPFSAASDSDWSKASSNAIWMAVSVKSNGVWKDWDVVRVKGEDGKSITGPAGPYCPPPQLWADYPVGYGFQDGTGASTTRNTVFHGIASNGKVMAYTCIRSHPKAAAGTEPGTTAGNSYWKAVEGGPYTLLSTEVMLAVNAYIRLLSSQGIRIYDEQNRIVGQMSAVSGAPQPGAILLPFFIGGVMAEDGTFSNGTGPLFAVDTSGRTYHGGISGQRIEIDPATKRLHIYGADGTLCAIHSGDVLDYTSVGNATGGSVDTVMQAGLSKTLYGSKTEYVDVTNGRKAGGDGTLTVSVPPFEIRASGTELADPDALAASCSLYAEVLFGSEVVDRYLVGGLVDVSRVYNTAPVTLQVNVPKDTVYTVRMRYVSNLDQFGVTRFTPSGSVSVSLNISNKVCHYGQNGWYISTSNRNFSYCIYDSAGRMHQKTVVNGTVMFDTDDPNKHF